MSLDVRTVVVVLLLVQLLMSATLLLDLRSGRAPGLLRWNLGLGLFAVGWLLIVLRSVVPPLAGVAAAHALLLAGLCSQYAALLEFGGRRVPPWLVPVPAALLFLALVPLVDRYAGMTLLVSSVHSGAFLALALVLVRLGAQAGPVRWLSGGILVLAALAIMARAIDIWQHPAATPDLFTASALHAFGFIMLLAVTVSTAFSFLVMQRRSAEARVRHLAMHDGLTDLYNRRALVELSERELARARRAGSPTAVLMLDLDHFKRINDAYGHAAGDRVLVDFAARLRDGLRAGDLAGRYGGEEFSVVLPATGEAAAAVVAERICAAVAARPLGDLEVATTASIGVAASAPGECGIEALLDRADRALYSAKQAGRNRVALSAETGVPSEPAFRAAA